jgi:hypothetical protein
VKHAREWWNYLRRPTIFPVIVAIIVGPIVSLLVFSLSDLQGMWRFVGFGTMVALVLGLIVAWLQRGAIGLMLSEVTVSIPEFSEVKFVVNSEYRRVAWKLFIETMTRVATQPLPTEHGFLREALTSLYGVFSTTRELLKTMEPSRVEKGMTVEILAMQMLNREIRPFLAKWHPALKRFEETSQAAAESEWGQSSACRSELDILRRRLVEYGKAFGELGGVKQLDRFFNEGTPLTTLPPKTN